MKKIELNKLSKDELSALDEALRNQNLIMACENGLGNCLLTHNIQVTKSKTEIKVYIFPFMGSWEFSATLNLVNKRFEDIATESENSDLH